MNPSSLHGKVPESYALHVPKGTADRLAAAFQQIPSNHLDAWRMHRVTAGETLAEIGKQYHVIPSSIVAANHMEAVQTPGRRPLADSRGAARREAGAGGFVAFRQPPARLPNRHPARDAGRSPRSATRKPVHKPAAIVARGTN